MSQTKTCSKCKEDKDFSQYSKSNKMKDGHKSQCKTCISVQTKANRLNNSEQIKIKEKLYRDSKRDHIREYANKWRNENLDKCRLFSKLDHQKHIEQRREVKKLYAQSNKDLMKEVSDKWYQENKIRVSILGKIRRDANPEYEKSRRLIYENSESGKAARRASTQNRRSRKLNTYGRISKNDIMNIWDKQQGSCVYCNCTLDKSSRNSYHCDHIIPLSKGGNNTPENAQLLCPTCNISKGSKNHTEFVEYIERNKIDRL